MTALNTSVYVRFRMTLEGRASFGTSEQEAKGLLADRLREIANRLDQSNSFIGDVKIVDDATGTPLGMAHFVIQEGAR